VHTKEISGGRTRTYQNLSNLSIRKNLDKKKMETYQFKKKKMISLDGPADARALRRVTGSAA